ncbi:flavin-dependent monooxygenase QhpG [Undibacterium sp. Ji83W]|uniref:flavin-dependent monooxygenase QhpG n=1 Tax=Undibacterium sp. Ji83W TaxID=3413043 RepID=UPI003BF37B56
MTSTESAVDVLIIGAGPAGLTAALRLLQLGYRVQVLERSATWPRPQIGEALTPGIRNIIAMLDANEAMQAVPHLAGLATRLCWRSKQPEIIRHGDAAVVNRAAFDTALLQLALQRGISLAMPAQVQDIKGSPYDWQISIKTNAGAQQTHARFILDASGRSSSQQQHACAPRLSAIWAELSPEHIPAELANFTQVEALEHGWLWGTRLPDRRYRIMLLSDPHTAHQQMPGQAEQWLRSHCASSQLFSAVAQTPYAGRLQACAATPYLSLDSWQDGRLKLGDAAFALDPVSSSGVEKAMRFSLQAVVAIHTILSGPGEKEDSHELARNFFEQRLIETSARHSYWTQSYYAQAWCNDSPFWQERAGFKNASGTGAASAHPLVLALQEQSQQLNDYRPTELKPLAAFNPHQHLRIHPATSMVTSYCVVDDKVQKQLALNHPNLERPISFLENQALLPHLDFLWQPQPPAHALKKLETVMGTQNSQKITAWLWQRGILESLA